MRGIATITAAPANSHTSGGNGLRPRRARPGPVGKAGN